MKPSFYREAIVRVLAHIDTHRGDRLDLDTLSKVAYVSKFHFHRIFKDHMGLTIGQYVKLKRLETGMWRLVYTDKKTLEIALESGYENHAAFTRAFTKEMGCSPRKFRERFYQNKKIALNQLQQQGPTFQGYQTRSPTKILYCRRLGSYVKSAVQAWNDLMIDLENNNVDTKKQNYYGISQDDPNAQQSDTESLRFDVGVESTPEIDQKKNGIEAKEQYIPSGPYAVFIHQGPLETLTNSYYTIYGKWIHDNDVRLKNDARPFIKYIDPFSTKRSGEQKQTEIWLPTEAS